MGTPARDVTQTVADTVRDAIVRHRPAIEQGAGRLAGLTVEVELRRDGTVSDVNFYTQHAAAHRLAEYRTRSRGG